MLTTPLIKTAINLAFEKHNGQFDKQGIPYVFHPYEVALKCETEEQIIVALLHDILEDTDETKEHLLALFPENIVDCIVCLTRSDDESYKDYIRRIGENELARYVKLRDLEHNSDPGRGIVSQSLIERYSWAKQYLNERR